MCIEWQLIYTHGGKPISWVVGLAFEFRFFGLDLIVFTLIAVEPRFLVIMVIEVIVKVSHLLEMCGTWLFAFVGGDKSIKEALTFRGVFFEQMSIKANHSTLTTKEKITITLEVICLMIFPLFPDSMKQIGKEAYT